MSKEIKIHVVAIYIPKQKQFRAEFNIPKNHLIEFMDEKRFRMFVKRFPHGKIGDIKLNIEGDARPLKDYFCKVLASYDEHKDKL